MLILNKITPLSYLLIIIHLLHANASSYIQREGDNKIHEVRGLRGTGCRRYLATNERLRPGEFLCNTYLDVFVKLDDRCELHYDDKFFECFDQIAEAKYNNDYDCSLVMQNDGNVVLYNSNNIAAWKTGTRGKNGRLYMPNVGQAILQMPLARDVGSHTNSAVMENNDIKLEEDDETKERLELGIVCIGDSLKYGKSLRLLDFICAHDGTMFGINSRGYLVTRACRDCHDQYITLQHSTKGYLQIHSDGNLVFYGENGVLWETRTRGENSWVGFTDGSVYVQTVIAGC